MKRLDLKVIRNQYKITQIKLSEMTGYPQGFISQMENGLEPMPKQFIEKVADVLGISDITQFLIDAETKDAKRSKPTINNSVGVSSAHMCSGISNNTIATLLEMIRDKDAQIQELSVKNDALKDEILELKLKLQALQK